MSSTIEECWQYVHFQPICADILLLCQWKFSNNCKATSVFITEWLFPIFIWNYL